MTIKAKLVAWTGLLTLSLLIGISQNQCMGAKNTTKYDPNEDAGLTFYEYTSKYGFKSENYTITTHDGYLLQIFRIPGLIADTETSEPQSKPPVLLQHGMLSDMMQWIFNKPEQAPAFVLARTGYDVWLGNNRGNRFGHKHVNLSSESQDFWLFDWEDMGTKDTTKVINFIVKKTGFDQISYIGHSEGATQIMAGASLFPKFYNSKIKVAFLLAPPLSLYNIKIPVLVELCRTSHERFLLEYYLDTLGPWDFLPYSKSSNLQDSVLCRYFDDACDKIVKSSNFDTEVDDIERLNVYLSYVPSGTGYRNLIHYGQLIGNKKESFTRYNLGTYTENTEKYGVSVPPEYDLTKVNFPIAILYGSRDELVAPKDAEWAIEQLKHTLIYSKEYDLTHISFAVARNMSWFSEDLMAILNKYNGKDYTLTPNMKAYSAQLASMNKESKQSIMNKTWNMLMKFNEYIF